MNFEKYSKCWVWKNLIIRNRISEIQCLQNKFQRIALSKLESRKLNFQNLAIKNLNFERLKLKKKENWNLKNWISKRRIPQKD